MDDARSLDACDPAPGRPVAVGQQGVHQGVARMTRGRVDDQTGGLVEDEQVIVLVDDRQRDVRRRLEIERRGLRDVSRRSVPAPRSRWAEPRPTVSRRPRSLDVSFATGRSHRPLLSTRPPEPSGTRNSRMRRPDQPSNATGLGSNIRPVRDERRSDGMTMGLIAASATLSAPTEVADADVDEVDDVAEPPIRSRCRAPRRQQPECDRQRTPSGGRGRPRSGDDREREDPEDHSVVRNSPNNAPGSG
jgi:hypothetical protein